MIKKIITLFVLSAFVLSCDSDDNDSGDANDSGTESLLVGEWDVTSFTFTGTGKWKEGGILPITADAEGFGYDMDKISFKITEDPDIIASEGTISLDIDIEIKALGQNLNEKVEDFELNFLGPWSHQPEANTFTLTIEGETVVADIIELTETKFKLMAPLKQTREISGRSVDLDIEAIITLEK
ncbi:MAG: hypothetical protein KAH07_07580 [Flavobacteriaceae bacterium]|nr:hypothetical protein [Flavobacteriaceae bacterium]